VDENIRITADRPDFTAVPNWVVELVARKDNPLSRDALVLYIVLRKFSDYQTGEAYPSRATLARAMGYGTPKPLDKLVRELEAHGLIMVERRKLEHYVNHYHVAYQRPFTVVPSSSPTVEEPQDIGGGRVQTDPTPWGSNGPQGRVQMDSRVGSKRTHYQEPSINNQVSRTGEEPLFEAEGSTAVAVREKNLKQEANIIAKRATEASNGSLSFMGMRGIADHFLHQGFSTDQVLSAMGNLWKNGRSVNRQAVGQVLQGIIKPDGTRPRKSTAQRNLEAGIRAIEMLKAEEETQEAAR
jgi:hypothetical protein